VTLIWRRQWDDPLAFRDVLRAEILRRAASVPSHSSHNQGGWRSRDDVLDWALDEVRLLRTRIDEVVVDLATASRKRACVFRAWAIVNRAGSYHRRHTHAESTWSGIYYVDVGGADSACTVFEVDPAPVRITPEPGLMVLFPSTIWHSVEPHHGNGNRITIAFDAR
jgi:hypothetical protein